MGVCGCVGGCKVLVISRKDGPIFILTHLGRKSNDSKSKVLADIDFSFITKEQDPIKHLRAVVAQGRISGMLVYPDYFVILGGNRCFLHHAGYDVNGRTYRLVIVSNVCIFT